MGGLGGTVFRITISGEEDISDERMGSCEGNGHN